jgi:hypothetical protein
MDIFSLLLIAISLAMDCFAIALGISCSGKRVSRAIVLRVAAAFGAAQAVMPALGWLAGRGLVNIISAYDHWVIFGLLLLVGIHMIWESFHEEEEGEKLDLTRGWALLSMAIITSIDAGHRAGTGLPERQYPHIEPDYRLGDIPYRDCGILHRRQAGSVSGALGRGAGRTHPYRYRNAGLARTPGGIKLSHSEST